jgi:hypothetical protein
MFFTKQEALEAEFRSSLSLSSQTSEDYFEKEDGDHTLEELSRKLSQQHGSAAAIEALEGSSSYSDAESQKEKLVNQILDRAAYLGLHDVCDKLCRGDITSQEVHVCVCVCCCW